LVYFSKDLKFLLELSDLKMFVKPIAEIEQSTRRMETKMTGITSDFLSFLVAAD